PRIEVALEDSAEGPGECGILQDDGPAAIPFSTVRKSGFPEIFRSDPGGAGVDERILRMKESISFHDVLPAGHPADVDSRRGEPAAHIVFVAVDASDRTSIEEDADANAPTGGVPEDGCLRIEEQDLVAGVREPKDSALHGTRLASVEREIGGRERVLAVTRRIPRDEDAALRGHARIDWEGRRGFAIREGPSGEIERFV